ncbi:dihydrofolate reductase [Paenibacillus solani]|uniref:dihydrofolate reductase n=1 Tax=Paenibacillus solani TaxID=1705565 RepID=UPI003D2C6846
MKKWKAIVAMSENFIIGSNNKIPWDIPEETDWFRQVTAGQQLIMGRKTFETIKNLNPSSIYYVLSRSGVKGNTGNNVVVVPRIELLDELLAADKEVWVCGGGEVYKQLLNECSELFLTIIKQKIDGDCRFPYYEKLFITDRILVFHSMFEIYKLVNRKGV